MAYNPRFNTAQVKANEGTLLVYVSGINPEGGTLRAAVYTEEGFLSEEIKSQNQVLLNDHNAITLEIKGLPYDEYAVAVYQDINNNNRLDRKLFGLPKEPFGLSGKKGFMNIPKYKRQAFLFASDNQKIEIKL